MRVLITGAGGTLGASLAPMLADAGHEPVLFDVRTLETPYEFVQGDVRTPEDVRAAVEGAEFVVHTAAIHGIHLASHSRREFYALNLTGTFNVWEAAVEADVQGIVFSSTMGVYKPYNKPLSEETVAALHEGLPLQPGDIYGYTKVAGEQMCRLYGREYGIPSVGLRYGMFVPERFLRYGIRLLYGGVATHDVVRAVMASLEALAEGKVHWDAFNVESLVPFTEEDGPQLHKDPLPVLDKYYPGATDLLRERGVESLAPIREYYPMEHPAQVLGFRPECNFDRWLEELRERPEERAEKSPPWP